MKKDLFANLPSEVIIDIISKLPICTILSCKCVCKSWLALLETPEFVDSHLLNVTPGLAVFSGKPKLHNFFEFEDGVVFERHRLFHDVVNLPYNHGCVRICGSANGLLFLRDLTRAFKFCICNPITRDYIEVDCHERDIYTDPPVEFIELDYNERDIYTDPPIEFVRVPLIALHCGFGASKISGQHKAVIIFEEENPSLSVCHAYTLETGLWRKISHITHPISQVGYHSVGALVNGNLHWLVLDLKNSRLKISCFDLQVELFSSLSSPFLRRGEASVGLTALDDCLCLCDSGSSAGFALWLMKEYGDQKSWIRQFFICNNFYPFCSLDAYPIKVFKNGDILMLWEDLHGVVSYYSKKDMTIAKIKTFNGGTIVGAVIYTPDFCSLNSFGRKNVRSF